MENSPTVVPTLHDNLLYLLRLICYIRRCQDYLTTRFLL
jgi:hypothetical protein